MPVNILMPALSPTMEKGNLSKWLKREGDKVTAGEVIAEIETDKATMEYESIDDGVLAKIVVPAGSADVPVNQLIAVLAQEGEDPKAAAAEAAEFKPTSAPSPAAPPSAAPEKGVTPSPPQRSADIGQGNKLAASPQAHSAPSPPRGEGAPAPGAGNRIFASPLARRLAKDAGIEVARVQGSGPHGRVIARDIEAAKSGQSLRAPAAAATGPAIAPSLSDQQIRALYEEGSYQVVPHDGMRRTIAQRLTASIQTIPHFYLTVDCNIGKLLEAREEINAAAPKGQDGRPAWKLSVNDFVIKALALALQRVPEANVTWTEAGMLKHTHSDIGVAVAMPGGLITPIIRSAEQKSLAAISNEMKDLAARARARRLKPPEYQGGTTAVSNLGMYGIKVFTAVINPPHATIMAVGVGEERAIVRDGKIEAAHIMSVTMSCDHRAVDGALGAELIGAFKALIENPVMMVV
jgi:pyruvate dehydrogenase E2 component (dihydrolipoamide acetyltransferase)